MRSNDKMLEGLYTIVIRLSGNKDPMNDDDATLEIGYSPDQIMKDARGNVGWTITIASSSPSSTPGS